MRFPATRGRVLVSCSVLLLVFSLPSGVAEAQGKSPKRVCIDTQKNRVVLKRRCKTPRFTEVTTDQLTKTPTLEVVTETFQISLPSTGDSAGRSVTCPTGKIVTGGGASVIDNMGLLPRTSIPLNNNGWQSRVEALQNSASGELTVYAICATEVEIA